MTDTFWLLWWTMALRDERDLEELQSDMRGWAKMLGCPINEFTKDRPHMARHLLQQLNIDPKWASEYEKENPHQSTQHTQEQSAWADAARDIRKDVQ